MREEGSDTKLKGKINNSRAEGGAFVLLPMILQNKSERDINKPWDFNIFSSRRNNMALEEIGYFVLRIGFRAVVRHLLEELTLRPRSYIKALPPQCEGQISDDRFLQPCQLAAMKSVYRGYAILPPIAMISVKVDVLIFS